MDLISDYRAIVLTDFMNNGAENLLASAPERESKPRRGRPESIDVGRLWGAREALLGLFEATWHEIGSDLPYLKSPEEVLTALSPWESRRHHHYVVQTLLRPSTIRAGSKQLRVLRLRLGEVTSRIRDAYEALGKCTELFEKAFRIPTAGCTENQREVIFDKIKERAIALARAGAEYLELQSRQAQMTEHLLDSEASFARAEFVRFCRSDRYRLKPLSTANAIAGLPFITWRQSTKRCRQMKRTSVKGQTYEIFEIIQRIVNSNTRRSQLVSHAERYLRKARSNEWDGIAELRKNWYYLNRAIRTCLDQPTRSPKLPYVIATEYWKRKNHPDAVDAAFDMEESIVV